MTLKFDHFFPPHIKTFVSDASIDFSLKDLKQPFSEQQLTYLSSELALSKFNICTVKQVHGNEVVQIKIAGKQLHISDADALITDQLNTAITVRTADCLSVFIVDPLNHAIGVAHAGWRGTSEKISAQTVLKMMQQYKSKVEHLKIAFGPSIRSCCYEVGEEFLKIFPHEIENRNNRIYLDLVKANKNQLLEVGVGRENILDSQKCTVCSPGFFSHRRDAQKAGRMLSFMMITT